MKLLKPTLYSALFLVIFFCHYLIWQKYAEGFSEVFFNYYLFLASIFIFVIIALTIAEKYSPGLIGFIFMGLLLFKLAIMFLVMQKLELSTVPNYKMHFIPPYLLTLLLETIFAVSLIKDEKNQ